MVLSVVRLCRPWGQNKTQGDPTDGKAGPRMKTFKKSSSYLLCEFQPTTCERIQVVRWRGSTVTGERSLFQLVDVGLQCAALFVVERHGAVRLDAMQ